MSQKKTKKKSFVLYLDALDILDLLTTEEVGELFLTIRDYVRGEARSIKKEINLAFTPIKNSIDRDYEKWESIRNRNIANGKLGGRPTNKSVGIIQEPKKPNGLSGNPKNPVSVNVNDNVNDKKEGIKNLKMKFEAYVDFLNSERKKFLPSSSGFKATNKKAFSQFKARLLEGYTGKDFQKVIKNAFADSWHKENNFKWLSPEFLTRNDKFERLLNSEDKTQISEAEAFREAKKRETERMRKQYLEKKQVETVDPYIADLYASKVI